jgi:hypothetical protein
MTRCSDADAISIEELDLLYRIPDSVPISVKEWLNIDELIDVSGALRREISLPVSHHPDDPKPWRTRTCGPSLTWSGSTPSRAASRFPTTRRRSCSNGGTARSKISVPRCTSRFRGGVYRREESMC